MSDVPALWINGGIFLATAFAAALAWAQAILAGRRQVAAKEASAAAEESRRQAVVAQQAAAEALREQTELERSRDAQANERVDVSWEGTWPTDIGQWAPITFAIRNIGTTDARGVVLTLHLPRGRQLFEIGDVSAGDSARVEISQTEMIGPAANASMRNEHIPKTVFWKSPAGRADSTDDVAIWVG